MLFIMALLAKCVLVSGLTQVVTLEDLSTAFAEFGDVSKVILVADEHGDPMGKAVVLFVDPAHATAAKNAKKKGTWTIAEVGMEEQDLQNLIKDQELEDLVLQSLKKFSTAGMEKMKRQFVEAGFALEIKQEDVSKMSTPKKIDVVPELKQDVPLRKVPKLPTFSGDKKSKDASFARWQYHIKVLQKGPYDEFTVVNAVHQSLRSPAADLVVNMAPDVKVVDLLKKFRSRYGSVLSVEALTEKLYSLKQQDKEDLATWAFRIEEVVYEIDEKGGIPHDEVPNRVRGRFWYGLQDSRIKEATRATWTRESFDDLLEQCRALEEEYGSSTASAKVHQHSSSSLEGKVDEMLKMFKDVDTRLKKVEAAVLVQEKRKDVKEEKSEQKKEKKQAFCTKCKKSGHLFFGCRKDADISCDRCGEKGHLKHCCRVPLN